MENAADDKPVTLLYVEDEADTHERVVSLLQLKFPKIILFKADNGKDGLDLFRSHRPDIVLTDIRMPVMDGIQMAMVIICGDMKESLNELLKFDRLVFDYLRITNILCTQERH